MKEFICFSFSSLIVIATVFLTILEYKKKVKFSSLLGIISTYTIDYILLLLPYLFYLTSEKYKSNISNEFILELFKNRLEIMVTLSIICCNKITKFLYNNVFSLKIKSKTNKTYKNIMCGLLYSILIVSIITLNIDLLISIILFFVGMHVDFEIKKEDKPSFTKRDFFQRIIVLFVCSASLLFFNLFNKHYVVYKIYFLLPWFITFVFCIIFITIIVIKEKNKSRNSQMSKH